MKTYIITPVPKPRMVRSDKWKKRKCVMNYWAFKDKCRALNMTLPQPCKITFFMPMPESWSLAKKNLMSGLQHIQKPDADNLCKAVLDAVYADDSHIWSIWIEKRWAPQGLITVEAL